MSTKTTLTANKDARIVKAGGSLMGAGAARELPVGYLGGFLYRALFGFPSLDVNGKKVAGIVRVLLKGHNTTPSGGTYILGHGSTPKVKAQRLTADFSEGTATVSSAGNSTTWSNQPAFTTTNQVTSATLPTADLAWWSVDVTDQYCDTLPTKVKRPDGSACGGGTNGTTYRCRLIGPGDGGATSETTATTAENTEVYDRSSGDAGAVYLEVEFDDNDPPNKPTNVRATGLGIVSGSDPSVAPAENWELATGSVLVCTATGTDFVVKGTHNDPDPGSYMKKWRIRAWASTVTDAQIAAGTAGTARNNVTFSAPPGSQPKDFASTIGVNTPGYTDPPFARRGSYRIQAVTQDEKGAWGADPVAGAPSGWSKVDDHLVTLDSKPYLRTPRISTGLVPVYSANIEDADSVLGGINGTVSAARILVLLSTPSTTVLKWDSGKVTGLSGTGFSLTYAGETLDPGVPVTVEMWLWDAADVMSDSSGKITSTPTAQTGPTTIAPFDTSTKQSTTNPSITITNASFDAYQRRLYRRVSGAWVLLSDSGIVSHTAATSKVVTTPAGLFGWGETFGVDAAVRPAGVGTLGEFSPIGEVYINAAPTAPNPGSIGASVYSGITSLSPAGLPYWTVVTTTPTLTFPNNDVDIGKGYVEAPSRREIEIDSWSGSVWAPVTGSPFIITTGITNDYAVPGGKLSAEGKYRARARYDDNASQRSAWSDYLVFRVSTAPVLTRTTPTAGATVTNPHPTLDYGITLTGGKAQITERVQVFDVSGGSADLLYDSGDSTDAGSDIAIPAFDRDTDQPYMSTGRSISAIVTVTDTDGLVGSVTFTFTTSFTKPVALTGLVLTPDVDASSVTLTVTASSDPNLAEYWWYRRGNGGALELIARTIDPTYVDYEAGQSVDVTYFVTQHSGAVAVGESDAIDGTSTLAGVVDVHVLPGDAAHTFELRYVSSIREDEPFAQGVFEPLPSEDLAVQPPIVRTGGSRGFRLTLTMMVGHEDVGIIRLLREVRTLYRTGVPFSILKSGSGDVWRVRVGEIPASIGAGDTREITISAIQVA